MNNTKVFVTGSAGLIGSTLYFSLKQDGFFVHGVDISTGLSVDSLTDVSLRLQLRAVLDELKPDIIIHVAAIKGLLNCENEKLKSWDVNVESTAEIVQYAGLNKIKIIYISSDMVFDGRVGNYKEGDLPNPINWYGITKFHSELLVQNIPNSAICRTALVFGNFQEKDRGELSHELESGLLNNQSLLPYYILSLLKKRKIVMLPNEVVSSPTHVNLLKKIIKDIIIRNLSGIYHCVGSEPISRYSFAFKIAESFGLDSTLVRVDESKVLDIRPKNLSMNIEKTYRDLNLRANDWNIASTIEHIKKSLTL